MKKRLLNILFIWLPLFFPVAYVGSYFALVKEGLAVAPTGSTIYFPFYKVPERLEKSAEFLFTPLHYLDRKLIRPRKWVVPFSSP